MSRTLIAFFSRADENYFGGSYRYVDVGNTEIAMKMIADMIDAGHVQDRDEEAVFQGI